MAKTFAVTAVLNATLTLTTAGVEEYITAIREANETGGMPGLGDKLVSLIDEGKVDEALSMLFRHGLRCGLKDMGEQLNNEFAEGTGKFVHAPATVAVTPQVPEVKPRKPARSPII